jgi:hypothetical protein
MERNAPLTSPNVVLDMKRGGSSEIIGVAWICPGIE